MSVLSYPARERTPLLAQLITAFVGGIFLFLGAIILWTLGYQLIYAGRIFPGVTVAGVDLSGMAPQAAALKLSQTLSYPISGKLVFRDGSNVWVASPAQLGMVFDPSASAESAYRLGRSGGVFAALDGQLRALEFGQDVSPVIVFDQRVANQYLQGLAQKINQPAVEASLHLEGTNVVARAGQIGRTLNVDATLTYLGARLRTFTDGDVPLVIQEKQPALMDVSSEADAARQILSQPLQLVIPNAGQGDPGPWVYDPQSVASMLGVERVQNGNQAALQILLDPGSVRQMLANIATQADRQAANAQFHFDPSTRQLVLITPAVTGRTIDVDASVKAINDALARGEHTVPIVMQETQPAASDDVTAQQLGITGLIQQQTSYFYGSPVERITNIQTAAARFDGVLVAPGETFSMGQTLGDVSLNNGYTEALIIYGNHTITGVGGGVCQVSTTLFRTVLYAGFPVVERVPHAYRVHYYEETSSGGDNSGLAGMDATVYFPLVDFKFTNDSQYWILMETNVDVGSRSLTWQFYSTPDGRSVTVNNNGGPYNLVPAPPASFVKNPDLPSNQKMNQTDFAANGADVDVTRTVTKGGAVYFQDEFKTHYEPWQAVCEYLPSVQDPAAEARHEGKCQPPALSMVQ
ncbi:MAG TPA: VanW family protein [Anaerolineales bacterium]|nr:VanW family protein [Anaerolineales bacterium]